MELRHEEQHQNGIRHHCTLDGSTTIFPSPYLLSVHYSVRHELIARPRELCCSQRGCDARFDHLADRRRHYEEEHQIGRSGPCPMCSLHFDTKTFRTQKALETHYLDVHGLVFGSESDPLSSVNQSEGPPQVRPGGHISIGQSRSSSALDQRELPPQLWPSGLFSMRQPRLPSLNRGFSYIGPRGAHALLRVGEEDGSNQACSERRTHTSLHGSEDDNNAAANADRRAGTATEGSNSRPS